MGSPVPSEATTLLEQMLLHDSRRDARLDVAPDIVVLEDQIEAAGTVSRD
jgi:RNA polymerase sigma-70 factor (ECF subfamily)